MKKIAIFGSTGSIGKQTLDVVSQTSGRFAVYALAANKSVDEIIRQIREYRPVYAVVADTKSFHEAVSAVGTTDTVITNDTSMLHTIAADPQVDIVVAAMVGFAGLDSTLAAVKAGKRVCIANKETLVVAGEIVTAEAERSGAEIIPIDSEHSAIAQCLVGESSESIKRIILTASGGPFRTRAAETFNDITVAEALRHPNWSMGQKITIDSATLMNKGLEVIEAHWLFGLPSEKIDIIVHPQSIIHSMVEFADGSIKAQLGAPDMRLPIQYALGYPERIGVSYDTYDLLRQPRLDFEEADTAKFPCLQLARQVMDSGGTAPCLLNGANEIAVEAFLDERIRFTDIAAVIEKTLENVPIQPLTSLDVVIEADTQARIIAKQFIHTRSIA